MFNPSKAAGKIKKEYMGYISTSFHFRNQILQKNLLIELDKTISNGPFVQIKDAFKSGSSIEKLITEGVISPLFKNIEAYKQGEHKLLISRPLYKHQEISVRKIIAGDNVVISTGTGSGKTLCFLIPVINELLREEEQSKLDDGVRAIFIYPMNALANDQIKVLREILMDYPSIRFGVYNGGTENREEDAIRLYELMYANEKNPKLKKRLPNEELSRDEMKKRPPHILFTNYAMLEHLLLRPGDDNIFEGANFRFVVLDEAHVYTGAKGIETSFLIDRLKGRLSSTHPTQFILTSATLGNNTEESKEQVAEFAEQLTGSNFDKEDIITSYYENSYKHSKTIDYPISLVSDLADEKQDFNDVLKKYKLQYDTSKNLEQEILYNIVSSSIWYQKMRESGNLLLLKDLSDKLSMTLQQTVSFIALCSKARMDGKPLVDIRYHYFLKALDGCYIALDHPESLSLIRNQFYHNAMMFEITVCEDCGEIAIVGKINNGKLVLSSKFDQDIKSFQIIQNEENEDRLNQIGSKDVLSYYLCKNCGAIVPVDELHNNWCKCGNTQSVKIQEINNNKCLNCGGNLKSFNLGYDAATSVIATSLYEQIPEYEYSETSNNQTTDNIFLQANDAKTKIKKITGRQFLIFSDSRQGAAKFACYLTESYKEFLRRRAIWHVVKQEDGSNRNLNISDFVSLLENFLDNKNIFKNSNSITAISSPVENRRNAWVAVLNELYNCNRDTSLVSLGKLSFEYLGNNNNIVRVVSEKYKISNGDAKNLLNFLAFKIVRSAALTTDNESDINSEDRKYLFFTSKKQTVRKEHIEKGDMHFLPSVYTSENGEKKYYRQKELLITEQALKIGESDAVKFLGYYWEYLISDNNQYKLETSDNIHYYMPAKYFKVNIGSKANLWKCIKCGKVTQFNIGNKCIQSNCDGDLQKLDSNINCEDNYFASLYSSDNLSPLFVKEHTAQLSRKEALEYQQQFINKEINALSCSTTFEMGIDVGSLETVFLRNFPPLASNYSQRVGRAGRSIDSAAFALTYAKLSSHDFTFFDNPQEMINGTICPPHYNLENEKILKRHIYATAIGLFFRIKPDMYFSNNAINFINNKGYKDFIIWLESKPKELTSLLENSFVSVDGSLKEKYITSYDWLTDFCGDEGIFTGLIKEYEENLSYLEKAKRQAVDEKNYRVVNMLDQKIKKFQNNELIDFLVRGNILPKYGFPVDSVELTQNISSSNSKSLTLSRDLSIAISEYAPSSEVVADGNLYTSRYIRKPIVNKSEMSDFETAYFATCNSCGYVNYSKIPVGKEGKACMVCGHELKSRDFKKSIEPRAGFIAEEEVKRVPLTSQEKKYKTEAIYIGDSTAQIINKFEYKIGKVIVDIESTSNDSLVVKSTDDFYVCPKCGFAIANDEVSKLKKYDDYSVDAQKICKTSEDNRHKNPFGNGKCAETTLYKFSLHHAFKTDVAKLSFSCDTSDEYTMLSVMYAILNAFSAELDIERNDIRGCLNYKLNNGKMERKIIIYDAVPGGAGHSRRLVTNDGGVFKAVIKRAISILSTCTCSPSCYRCLRSYENQRIHEFLDREKALDFLKKMEDRDIEKTLLSI